MSDHATVKDVANMAGVSTATVSRVLNGSQKVTQKTRDKVCRAMGTLDFSPNAIARALKVDSSRTIGFIASDLRVSFFSTIFQRIEKSFFHDEYITFAADNYDDPAKERVVLSKMVERKVDALVINSTGQNEDYIKQICDSGIPVLFYDRRPQEWAAPYVGVDKETGMAQLLDYLYQLGHRKYALVTGNEKLASNIERKKGVETFCKNRSLAASAITSFYGAYTKEFAEECMREIRSDYPDITAIITGSSALAAGILSYCQQNNVSIPGDYSLISFGGFQWNFLTVPRLTYLDDKASDVAASIVSWLRRNIGIEGKRKENSEVIIQSKIVFGNTCAKQGAK